MTSHEVTDLLERWTSGEAVAFDRLLPLVYRQLRILAIRRLRIESSGHTLQPTALVHEAYVKLLGQDPGRVENRVQFYALAAKAMRQVLVDHARRKGAEKRTGKRQRVTLTDALGHPWRWDTAPSTPWHSTTLSIASVGSSPGRRKSSSSGILAD